MTKSIVDDPSSWTSPVNDPYFGNSVQKALHSRDGNPTASRDLSSVVRIQSIEYADLLENYRVLRLYVVDIKHHSAAYSTPTHRTVVQKCEQALNLLPKRGSSV